MFISVVLLAFMVVSTVEAPKMAYSVISQKYDGTKTYITIWFDHLFTSQNQALTNMTVLKMKGGMLIVYDKANTTGYLTWKQIHNRISQGWEPISHSMDHAQISTLTSPGIIFNETKVSKASLQYNQNILVTGYVSPYDKITPVSAQMINQTYQWTVIPGCKQNTVKSIAGDGAQFGLTIPVLHHCGVGISGSPINTVSQVKALIDYAVANKTWLILSLPPD